MVSDAQKRAKARYEKNNAEKTRIDTYRRQARLFIGKHADLESLNEIERLIQKRRENITGVYGWTFLNEWLETDERYCVIYDTRNFSILDREEIEDIIRNSKYWPAFYVVSTLKDDDLIKEFYDFVGGSGKPNFSKAVLKKSYDREFIRRYFEYQLRIFKENNLTWFADLISNHLEKYFSK